MTTFSDLISQLCQLTGVKSDDQDLIGVLSNAELTKINVPNSISNAIMNGLMTLDSAKNNWELKNHFKASNLAPIDESIMNLMNDLELGEDSVNSVKSEKNTYAKLPLVLAALKSKLEGAANSGQGANVDVEAFNKQITDLNAQIETLKTNHGTAIEELNASNETKLLNLMINNYLSGKTYAAESENTPKELLLPGIYQKIQDAFNSNQIKPILNGNNINLRQIKNPEMEYFKDNKPVSFSAFVDSILAENKLLAVSNHQQQNPGGVQTPITVAQGGEGPNISDDFFKATEENAQALSSAN